RSHFVDAIGIAQRRGTLRPNHALRRLVWRRAAQAKVKKRIQRRPAIRARGAAAGVVNTRDIGWLYFAHDVAEVYHFAEARSKMVPAEPAASASAHKGSSMQKPPSDSDAVFAL